MRRIIVLLVICIVFISCNENRIYEEHIDPSGNLEWNKSEVVTFDVEIIDASIKYDVILALRFATGFRYSTCPITITETTPSGETREYSHEFKTRNDKGYAGEAAGDIYDLEEIWRSDYIFPEKGTYHYNLRHEISQSRVDMVMEVGMIVDKVVEQSNQP